jgi:hypothetical protein
LVPGDPKECRERALRCAKLAAEARTPQIRDSILDIAQTWSRLADELEQTQRLIDALDDIDPHGLHVEMRDDEMIVTLPHTRYAVTYYKSANDPQLQAKDFPLEGDPRSDMSQAEFMAHAWKLANDKARRLGWIV